MRRGKPAPWAPGMRRRSPWRDILRLVIVLTLPCYCIGGLILAGSSLVDRLQRGGEWSPWWVVAALVLLLILLTEPFHGVVSTLLELGVESAETVLDLAFDPLGCALLLVLLLGLLVLLGILFGPALFNPAT